MQQTWIGDTDYYWTRTLSGYKTRLFYNKTDVFAEEKWLNSKWIAALTLVDDCYLDTETMLAMASKFMRTLIKATNQGLLPIDGLPHWPEYTFYIWADPSRPPAVIAFLNNEPSVFGRGEDAHAIEAQLTSSSGRSHVPGE